MGVEEKEYIVRNSVHKIRDNYDFILIITDYMPPYNDLTPS